MCSEMVRRFCSGFLCTMVLAAFSCQATAQETAQTDEDTIPAVEDNDAGFAEVTSTAEQPVDEQSPEAEHPEETSLEPIPDSLDAGPTSIKPAGFNGVVPGVTTMEEVEKAWGAPRELQKHDGILMQLHSVDPFGRVEVSFFENKVSSIIIRLDRAFPAKTVAEQLDLTELRPVLVSDELGRIIGQAYPERGVLFAFVPGRKTGKATMNVAQIILEPISAEPFVLRAETTLKSDSELSLLDLQSALKLQPDNARAHWLHSRILIAKCDYDAAMAAADKAIRLEPTNPHYRVIRARILSQTGRLKEAAQEAQNALKTSSRRPHVKARALCLLGDLIASGQSPNYDRAVQYHIQAVKTADPLTTEPHPAIRTAAKEVLIDAHLGAAHDIAWGSWKEKNRAVARWLDQAGKFAEDLIENEGAGCKYRFRVNTRALAACVGTHGGLDPTDWAQGALQNGEQLIAEADDPKCKAKLQWELGIALYDALQIYQMRNDHQTALKYGERAVEYLNSGSRLTEQTAADNYLLGRLYFRMGAVYAIRDKDHQQAVSWFDKAVPLLKQPDDTDETFADLGRHGETFVSMGVSYWETDQREKAVELTEYGLKLMERAVELGSLDRTVLAVPYDNLASMHRRLGAEESAVEFEEMAAKINSTKMQ